MDEWSPCPAKLSALEELHIRTKVDETVLEEDEDHFVTQDLQLPAALLQLPRLRRFVFHCAMTDPDKGPSELKCCVELRGSQKTSAPARCVQLMDDYSTCVPSGYRLLRYPNISDATFQTIGECSALHAWHNSQQTMTSIRST